MQVISQSRRSVTHFAKSRESLTVEGAQLLEGCTLILQRVSGEFGSFTGTFIVHRWSLNSLYLLVEPLDEDFHAKKVKV